MGGAGPSVRRTLKGKPLKKNTPPTINYVFRGKSNNLCFLKIHFTGS